MICIIHTLFIYLICLVEIRLNLQVLLFFCIFEGLNSILPWRFWAFTFFTPAGVLYSPFAMNPQLSSIRFYLFLFPFLMGLLID